MPKEIERKFLVNRESWREFKKEQGLNLRSLEIKQGYLSKGLATVRVRTVKEPITSEVLAYLTVKGPTDGLSRDEFEYAIPVDHAEHMLNNLVHRYIHKVRYVFIMDGYKIEVDDYLNLNNELITAEIEFETEKDAESFDHEGHFLFEEDVSMDPLFRNSALVERIK